MFPLDDGGPGHRSLSTARGNQVPVRGRYGSQTAGGSSSQSETLHRGRPRSTTPAPKPGGSNPFTRCAIRASEVARCPEVLAVLHLPPARPTRTLHQDRLVLAVATYGNRALPPAAIAERCQAWLGIAPRATAAALARLRHQGALLVDDDRRLEPSTAYKARARKEHSLFRFARENLEWCARRAIRCTAGTAAVEVEARHLLGRFPRAPCQSAGGWSEPRSERTARPGSRRQGRAGGQVRAAQRALHRIVVGGRSTCQAHHRFPACW